MKRKAGFVATLFALLLALFAAAQAETYTASVVLSPLNEPPPVPAVNANGLFLVTIQVNRDAVGNITGGAINFLGQVTFLPAGSVTISGLHIHEQVTGQNGSVRFDSGISGGSPLTFATGTGLISLNATSVDATVLGRLIANPTGFYVNLHTTTPSFPAGAIRGQITKLIETQAVTVQMNTANEVPPATDTTGNGVATLTFNPTRNPANGQVTGGTAIFSMVYSDFPASTNISGLHIHEAAAGVNGSIVIATSASGAAPIALGADGKGTYSFPVPITTAAQIGALSRLLANPAGFYVNAHTALKPGGVIRAQLATLAASPAIQLSNTYFLQTGNTDATVSLVVTGFDLATTVLVNGQPVPASLDINTGRFNVTIPATLRANPGSLFIQARTGLGGQSAPLIIPVAAAANVNTVAATTVDAAKFLNVAAPDAIVAAFGTKLASQTLSATTTVLPITLDGTTVLVNGVAARLFFVSQNQINYLIPPNTVVGQMVIPGAVVITAKDGTVSVGSLNVQSSIPALFTRLATGLGAPAANASVDGQVFNINLSNADGTAVAIDAGNFVSLFGTGFRYGSTPTTITIGGTSVTPTFVGAQGQFDGLDQINLQIPQSLAGRGDVDLVMTVDGKTSNTVKLKIK